MVNASNAAESVYDLISGDEEGRVCKDIPDDACDVVPGNFFIHLGSRILTKTGDALSSPSLVLAWLLPALAAPGFLVAALVPIREAGSLLPQMIFGGAIRRFPVRKWFWVAGSTLQGLAVLSMATVAFFLEAALAGWLILAALVVFSLSRGICSVATKDLVGKTVPKTRRGRLGGLASTASGVAAAAVGVGFIGKSQESVPVDVLGLLLLAAGVLWLLAAAAMAMLAETPGATSGGGNALREAVKSLRILKDDVPFRNFCIARALLASTVLSMPFYVVLARRATDGESAGLGLLLIASSVATGISAAVWGWLADRSSRLTMAVAGGFSALIGLSTFLVSLVEVGPGAALWIFGGLFFLLGLGHTGIRLGRKTYLVDLAPSDDRAAYVAVSNTLIGIVLLLSGSVGALSGMIGERGIILVFALLGAAGSIVSLTLKEATAE